MQSFDKNDVEQIKDILKSENFESVIIGGGEPLLWKYGVFNFIEELKPQNYLIQIGTNGILLDENFHENKSVQRWVLPLESLNTVTHNKMRPSKVNHHQIILQRINKLKDLENSLTLSTVITKRNKQDILELAEFFREFHLSGNNPIHAWHLYQFVPTGRGGEFSKDILLLDNADYEDICNSVISLKLPFKVYKRRNMPQAKTVTFFWKAHNHLQRSTDN
jgi:MoaA/NifB/PqqE/SkfB family radical SAM enzyme